MFVAFGYFGEQEVVGVGEIRLEASKPQILKDLTSQAKEVGFYFKSKEERLTLSRQNLIRFAFQKACSDTSMEDGLAGERLDPQK